MEKQIDKKIETPICTNCDGVLVAGKCKGENSRTKERCPDRYKDKFQDWYEKQ